VVYGAGRKAKRMVPAVYQWCGFKSRREKNKNLTALKSNSNTVWFNFQTYIYIYIYIPCGACVPHKNNCTHKNWFTRHEKDRFLDNHCQECVRAYLSIHDCLSFLHEVMIGNHRTNQFLQ
jgi:hypothetical protein